MKMVSRKISAIYTGSLIFISALFFIILTLICFLHYDQLITWIVLKMKKPELDGLLRQRALPFEKFRTLQKLAVAGLFILPVLAYILYKTRESLIQGMSFILQTVGNGISSWIHLFRRHSKREKTAFCIVLFGVFGKSLYYIISRDLNYDEMWSYNYYTATPFYFSFFMYNNYPLYEIFTHAFKWLPLPDKINLRLPVLFAGLTACTILYYYLFRYFKNQFTALLGIILFAFMPPATTYMLFGRGVIFEMLFAIVALFSLLRWLDSPDRNDQAVIFVLANIFGMYSMPSHIYFWICLDVFVLFSAKYQKPLLVKLIIMNGWILLGTFFCYLPVLLGSGISFLTTKLKPTETLYSIWIRLPKFIGLLSDYLTGFYFGLLAIIILCICVLLFRKSFARFQPVIGFCLILSISPAIFYLVQQFFNPERTMSATGLVIPLMACVLFQVCLDFFSNTLKYAILVISGITAAGISHHNRAINWSRDKDQHVKELSRIFLNRGIITCYDNSSESDFNYYYPGIEYYYRQEGKSIRLTLSDPRSLRYKPYSAVDHYDCIVLPADTLQPSRIETDKLLFRQPEEGFAVFLLN